MVLKLRVILRVRNSDARKCPADATLMRAVPGSVSVGKKRRCFQIREVSLPNKIADAAVSSRIAVVRVTGDCMMQVWQM